MWVICNMTLKQETSHFSKSTWVYDALSLLVFLSSLVEVVWNMRRESICCTSILSPARVVCAAAEGCCSLTSRYFRQEVGNSIHITIIELAGLQTLLQCGGTTCQEGPLVRANKSKGLELSISVTMTYEHGQVAASTVFCVTDSID